MDPAGLEEVVRSGNVRERMTLLYNAYSSRWFRDLFHDPLDRPEDLQAEQAQRTRSQSWTEYSQRKKRIEGNPALSAGARKRLIHEAAMVVHTAVLPSQVRPALSDAEIAVAVDSAGRLTRRPSAQA